MSEKIEKSKDEWKKILTKEQYQVLRKESTDRPFTGDLWDNHKKGIYKCAGCGAPLFDSETKFKSGTGWPSFFQPINEDAIEEKIDRKLWMVRREVHCKKCGGHQGHVFEDGPKPTGLRYCINTASLKFEEVKDIKNN